MLAKNAEESLDLVQPGRAGRREVEMDARVGSEPLQDFRRAVRGGVIEDHMELLARILTNDQIHESDEVLGGVGVGAAMHDFPSGRI